MRVATRAPVSTFGAWTSTAPTPSCLFPSSPSNSSDPVVLDEIGMATDLADQIGLVPSGVEVPMADLSIVIGADRIIALADMQRDMDILRQALDGEIDGLDRTAHLIVARRCQIGLIDLNMLAAGFGKPTEIVVQQLCCIEHHPLRVVVVLVIGHGRKEMRPGHRYFYRSAGKLGNRLEFINKSEVSRI